MQLIPITAPVCLQTKDQSITMPILISNQSPINLLGRDALCKLGLQIRCSTEGIYIAAIGKETQMVIAEAKSKCLLDRTDRIRCESIDGENLLKHRFLKHSY